MVLVLDRKRPPATRQLSGHNRGGWRMETAPGVLCDVGVVVRGAVVTI